MGTIADAFDQWMRNNVVDGDTGSGINPPSKAEGRAIGALIEAAITSGVSTAFTAGGSEKMILDVGDETTALTAGAAKKTLRLPYGFSLAEVRASLSTASASGDVKVDVNVGGVSVLSSPIQIDATTTTSVGSAAPPAIATSELDDNAEVTIDIDAAGSGAKGLKVYMIGTWAPFGVGAIPYYVTHATGLHIDAVPMTYPAGIADKDVIKMSVRYRTVSGAPTVDILRPSGWNTMANPVDTATGRTAWFWRRANGAESGTTQSVGFSGAVYQCGAHMSVWRGCVQNGDPFESLATNHGGAGPMSGQGIVTLGPNRRAVTDYADDGETATDPDVGWTEVYDDVTGTSTIISFVGSAQAVPLAASVAAEERSSVGAEWASATFALVPGT